MNRKQSSFEQAIFKVKQHKHWRRQEALAVLQEWQRSGLSLEAFSRLHGLTPRRISDWKKRIDRQPESPTTGLGFVELQIVEIQQSTQQPTEQPLAEHPSAQATPPPLEVILRGERIVRVQPGCAAPPSALADLRQQIRALLLEGEEGLAQRAAQRRA